MESVATGVIKMALTEVYKRFENAKAAKRQANLLRGVVQQLVPTVEKMDKAELLRFEENLKDIARILDDMEQHDNSGWKGKAQSLWSANKNREELEVLARLLKMFSSLSFLFSREASGIWSSTSTVSLSLSLTIDPLCKLDRSISPLAARALLFSRSGAPRRAWSLAARAG